MFVLPTFNLGVVGSPTALVLPSITNTKSISLDGTNDYMDIPDSTALETTAFTWSVWFYCTAINRYNIIVDTATNSGTFNGYEIFVVNTTNKIRFASYSGNDYIDSTTTVAANTWYHVAATHESGSDKLYVNGSLEASGSASSFQVSDAANLRIGSSSIFNLHHQGLIDEVSFFNYALSAPEVASLIDTTGTNPVPANIYSLSPVGWWRMGDGSDGSGNNDGTVVGGLPQIYNVAKDGSDNRITGMDGSLTNIASPNGIVADVPS